MDKIKSTAKFKKNPVRNEWLRNVGRSLGMSAMDALSDIAPATIEFTQSSMDTATEIYNDIRTNKPNSKRVLSSLGLSDQYDIGKKGIQNAIEDIKSGKIYNKDREDSMFSDDDFGMEDFDFDSDGGDFDSGDNESDTIVNVTDNSAMADAINRQSNVIVSVADNMIAENRQQMATEMMMSRKISDVSIRGISSINDNLSLLVGFNNNNMNNYINASIEYYESSLNKMQESIDLMISTSTGTDDNTSSNTNSLDDQWNDVLLTNGGLNLKGYMKTVKKNFNTAVDEDLVLSSIKMFLEDKDTMEYMIASPLKFMSTGVIKSLMPIVLEDAIKKFDTTIANFFPSMLMKLTSMEDDADGNIFKELIGKVFGIKLSNKNDVDVSAYKKDKVDFDGITRKSITEVIPTYLRKILSAVSGKAEIAYDYNTGRFNNIFDIKKKYEDDISEKARSGYKGVISSVTKSAKAIKFVDEADEKEFNDGISKFFSELGKNGKFFNPFTDDMSKYTDVYDFNGNSGMQSLFKTLLTSLDRKDIIKINKGIIDSRKNLNNHMSQLESFGNGTGVENIFNNGIAIDDIVKKEEENGVTKYTNNASKLPVDRYNLNTLHYMRRIENILMKGIRVFPINNTISSRSHEDIQNNEISLPYDKMHTSDDNKLVSRSIENLPRKLSEDEIEEYKGKGITVVRNPYSLSNDETGISEAIKTFNENQKNEKKENQKESTIQKLGSRIVPEDHRETWNNSIDKLRNIITSPGKALAGVIGKLDNVLFNLIFGTNSDSEGISFVDRMIAGFNEKLGKMVTFFSEKILNPLHEKLFGEDGLFEKIKSNSIVDKLKNKVKSGFGKFVNFLWGEKNENGLRENGLVSEVSNSIKDTARRFTSLFTGKYTDKDGNVHYDDNNVFSSMKGVFSEISGSVKEYFSFSKKDKDGKIVNEPLGVQLKNHMVTGFTNFSNAIFGENSTSEERTREMFSTMKKTLPKAISTGLLAGGAMTMLGSHGFLGSLFLPGGPVGGAILGFAGHMLTKSERFMGMMFGKKDADGKRVGGIISKKFSDFVMTNKSFAIGGATLGLAKNFLGFNGFGILPNFLLPGGPIGGALMGAAVGLMSRSEKFQNLMFGAKNSSGKFVGGLLSGIKNAGNTMLDKMGSPKISNILAGATGGSALALVGKNMGMLGAWMTPVGPIGGALMGAAAGIALSSKKWRKMVFGEVDKESGKREGGILGVTGNWFTAQVLNPMKDVFSDVTLNMKNWFAESIAFPFREALYPIKREISYMVERVQDMFKNGWNAISNGITKTLGKYVIEPMGKLMRDHVLTPLKKMLGIGFKTALGIFKMSASLPFKLLRMVGHGVEKRQERRGKRNYIKDLKEKRANNEINLYEYLKGRFDKDAINTAKTLEKTNDKDRIIDEANKAGMNVNSYLNKKKDDARNEYKQQKNNYNLGLFNSWKNGDMKFLDALGNLRLLDDRNKRSMMEAAASGNSERYQYYKNLEDDKARHREEYDRDKNGNRIDKSRRKFRDKLYRETDYSGFVYDKDSNGNINSKLSMNKIHEMLGFGITDPDKMGDKIEILNRIGKLAGIGKMSKIYTDTGMDMDKLSSRKKKKLMKAIMSGKLNESIKELVPYDVNGISVGDDTNPISNDTSIIETAINDSSENIVSGLNSIENVLNNISNNITNGGSNTNGESSMTSAIDDTVASEEDISTSDNNDVISDISKGKKKRRGKKKSNMEKTTDDMDTIIDDSISSDDASSNKSKKKPYSNKKKKRRGKKKSKPIEEFNDGIDVNIVDDVSKDDKNSDKSPNKNMLAIVEQNTSIEDMDASAKKRKAHEEKLEKNREGVTALTAEFVQGENKKRKFSNFIFENGIFQSKMLDKLTKLTSGIAKGFKWAFGKKGILTALFLFALPMILKLMGKFKDGDPDGPVDQFGNDIPPTGLQRPIEVGLGKIAHKLGNWLKESGLAEKIAKATSSAWDNFLSKIPVPDDVVKNLGDDIIKNGADDVGKHLLNGGDNVIKGLTNGTDGITAKVFKGKNKKNYLLIDGGKNSIDDTIRLLNSGSATDDLLKGLNLNSVNKYGAENIIDGKFTVGDAFPEKNVNVNGMDVASEKASMVTKFINTCKKIIRSTADMMISAFSKIGKSAQAVKGIPKIVHSAIEQMCKYLDMKNVMTQIGKMVGSVASLGFEAICRVLTDKFFVTYGAITGFGEAHRLFGIRKDDVDVKMRLISSAFKGFMGYKFWFLIELLNEIVEAIVDWSFFRTLAVGIYKIFADDLDDRQLDAAMQEFRYAHQSYQDRFGVSLSFDEFVDLQNKFISEHLTTTGDIYNTKLIQHLAKGGIKYTNRLAKRGAIIAGEEAIMNKIGKEAFEKIGKKASSEATEKAINKAGKKALSKQLGKKAMKEASEEAIRKAGIEAIEKAAKEKAKKETMKHVGKKSVREIGEQVLKESGEGALKNSMKAALNADIDKLITNIPVKGKVINAGKSIVNAGKAVGNVGIKVAKDIGSKVGNTTVVKGGTNLVKSAGKGVVNAAKSTGNTIKKVGKEIVDHNIGMVDKVATKMGNTKMGTKVINKFGGNTAKANMEVANSSILTKFKDLCTKAMQKIADAFAGKFPAIADDLMKQLTGMVSGLTDDMIKPFIGRITKGIAGSAAGVSTAGIWAAIEFSTGALYNFGARETADLFEVTREDVDYTMRTIASILEGLLNVSWAFVIDILNDIYTMYGGEDFIKIIATSVYKMVASQEDEIKLEDAQVSFKEKADIYNKENGTNLTASEYSATIENASWFQKKRAAYKEYKDSRKLNRELSEYNKQNGQDISMDEYIALKKTRGRHTGEVRLEDEQLMQIKENSDKRMEQDKALGMDEKLIQLREIKRAVREDGLNVVSFEAAADTLDMTQEQLAGIRDIISDTMHGMSDVTKARMEEITKLSGPALDGCVSFVDSAISGLNLDTLDSMKAISTVSDDKFEAVRKGVEAALGDVDINVAQKMLESGEFTQEQFDAMATIIDATTGGMNEETMKKLQPLLGITDENMEATRLMIEETMKHVNGEGEYLLSETDKLNLGVAGENIEKTGVAIEEAADSWSAIVKDFVTDKWEKFKKSFSEGWESVCNWWNGFWEKENKKNAERMQNPTSSMYQPGTPEYERLRQQELDAQTKKGGNGGDDENGVKLRPSKAYEPSKNAKIIGPGGYLKNIHDSPNETINTDVKIPNYLLQGGNGDGDMYMQGGGNGGNGGNYTPTVPTTHNNFAYYSQNDPAYNGYVFDHSKGNGKSKNPTISARGCGPTSMAMVATQLTGQTYLPTTLAGMVQSWGHSSGAGTGWGFFPRAAKEFSMDIDNKPKSMKHLEESLKAGRPVIMSGKKRYTQSPFTTGGHFSVAVGLDGNKVIMNDPRGTNKSVAYDMSNVIAESENQWSFKYNGGPTPPSNGQYSQQYSANNNTSNVGSNTPEKASELGAFAQVSETINKMNAELFGLSSFGQDAAENQNVANSGNSDALGPAKNLEDAIIKKSLDMTANSESGNRHWLVANDVDASSGKKISPSIGLIQMRGGNVNAMMRHISSKNPSNKKDLDKWSNYAWTSEAQKGPWSTGRINELQNVLKTAGTASDTGQREWGYNHVKNANFARVKEHGLDKGVLSDPRSAVHLSEIGNTGPALIKTFLNKMSSDSGKSDKFGHYLSEFKKKSYWGGKSIYNSRLAKLENELRGWNPVIEGGNGEGDGEVTTGSLIQNFVSDFKRVIEAKRSRFKDKAGIGNKQGGMERVNAMISSGVGAIAKVGNKLTGGLYKKVAQGGNGEGDAQETIVQKEPPKLTKPDASNYKKEPDRIKEVSDSINNMTKEVSAKMPPIGEKHVASVSNGSCNEQLLIQIVELLKGLNITNAEQLRVISDLSNKDLSIVTNNEITIQKDSNGNPVVVNNISTGGSSGNQMFNLNQSNNYDVKYSNAKSIAKGVVNN